MGTAVGSSVPLFCVAALLVKLVAILGRHFGRPMAVLITESFGIGVFLLFLLGCDLEWNPYVLLSLSVFRASLSRSTGGMTAGMLMQSAAPNERGFWAAVNSFNSKGIPLTPLLGGWIADEYNLITLFKVGLIAYLIALIPMVLLYFSGKVKNLPMG